MCYSNFSWLLRQMRARSCAEQTLGADHLLEYLEELSVHAGARIPTPQAVLRIIASKACRYPPPPPLRTKRRPCGHNPRSAGARAGPRAGARAARTGRRGLCRGGRARQKRAQGDQCLWPYGSGRRQHDSKTHVQISKSSSAGTSSLAGEDRHSGCKAGGRACVIQASRQHPRSPTYPRGRP